MKLLLTGGRPAVNRDADVSGNFLKIVGYTAV